MPAKFEASALFEFLGRVDRELAARSIIFLIGGSAVSIIDPAHSTSVMRTFVEAALACHPDRGRRGDQPRPRIPLEVRLMPRQVHHLVERHPGIGAARARNPQAERRVGHVVPARFADP